MQVKLVSEKYQHYLIMIGVSILSFIIGFFVVNFKLYYHFQQVAWQSDGVFFLDYLSYAGGIGEYLALFFAQFFYWNWLGSLIVSVIGFLIGFFIYKTIILTTEKIKLLNLTIPLVQLVILALMFDYKYPFALTINLFLVSLFLYVSNLLENNSKSNIPFFTVFIGILIYYLCGGMFFLIFMSSSLVILFNKPNKKTVLKSLLIIAAGFVIPFVAFKFVFLTSLKSSFLHSTPDVAVMIRYSRPTLFFIGLIMIPAFFMISKITSINLVKYKNRNKNKLGKSVHVEKNEVSTNKSRKKIIGFSIQMILLIGIAFFLFEKVNQPQEKLKVEIDYAATEGNWDKVISLSNKLTSFDRMSNFQYIRAIAHEGELLEKLFYKEQILGSKGLFLDRPFYAETAIPNSDLYFDLGNIDESLRYAFESQTLMSNSPRVLKRLILNCIILEKWSVANTYINVLDENPMEKEWIEKYKRFILHKDLSNKDSLIAAKRRDLNKTEGLYVTPRTKLISLLQQNPLNKLAFEYLIAFDLMEHDLASLINDMDYYSQFNYNKMPGILEEAVVLFRSQKRDNEFLNRIRISAKTLERFRNFTSLTRASKGDKKKAMETTLEYKDTYWYYVLFLSPLVTNLTIEQNPVEANY